MWVLSPTQSPEMMGILYLNLGNTSLLDPMPSGRHQCLLLFLSDSPSQFLHISWTHGKPMQPNHKPSICFCYSLSSHPEILLAPVQLIHIVFILESDSPDSRECIENQRDLLDILLIRLPQPSSQGV
jgi:hypothetical protein